MQPVVLCQVLCGETNYISSRSFRDNLLVTNTKLAASDATLTIKIAKGVHCTARQVFIRVDIYFVLRGTKPPF